MSAFILNTRHDPTDCPCSGDWSVWPPCSPLVALELGSRISQGGVVAAAGGRRPGARRRGGPNASVGGSGLIALHRRLNAVEACDLLCLRQVDVPKRVYTPPYIQQKNSSVLRVVLPLPLCGAYTLPR